MSSSVEDVVQRSDLLRTAGEELVASGVFQFPGGTYSVQFTNEAGLLECLDMMMAMAHKPGLRDSLSAHAAGHRRVAIHLG